VRLACPKLLLCLALGLGLTSCGGEAPEVLALSWRLEMRPQKGGYYESLSIFANVHDFDGPEDIESLSLSQDASGLAWVLDGGNWSVLKEGDDTWIGGADLAMADRSALPRGVYRLVATDLSGQRAERSFTLDCEAPRKAPPSVTASGKLAEVDSVWPETALLAYDAAGILLQAKPIGRGSNDLEGLLSGALAGKTASVAVYGYDPQTHCGAFSWKTKR